MASVSTLNGLWKSRRLRLIVFVMLAVLIFTLQYIRRPLKLDWYAWIECPEEYKLNMYPFVECYNNLCNSDIAVAVLFSNLTLKRFKTGAITYWPKYAGKMSIVPYGPQHYSEIPGLRSTNSTERKDNQVADFVVAMWKHLLENSPNHKWYLKIDDDSFVFPPNLLRQLSEYDPNEMIYGGNWITIENLKFASGGAGYFFSRPALEVLAKHLDGCLAEFHGEYGDKHNRGAPEDVVVTLCARKHVPNLKEVDIPAMNAYKGRQEQLSPTSRYPLTIHEMFEKESFLLNRCLL